MHGYASYDLGRGAFTAFEMIAVGHRRGYTQNNARSRGPQEGTIGFVFTLAEDAPAERVPPAFIDIYDAIPKNVRLRLGEPPAGSIYNGLSRQPVIRRTHRLKNTANQ